MTAHESKLLIGDALKQHGIVDQIDSEHSQYLDLPEGVYAELVIKDAGKEGDVERAVGDLDAHIDIHPIWRVLEFGATDVARSSSGGIVAASAIPVKLQSGSVFADVQVVVTFLAEKEMEKLLGANMASGKSIPGLLAQAYVESLLRWGGRDYWDPRRQDRLEIAYDRALALYPTLKKSA